MVACRVGVAVSYCLNEKNHILNCTQNINKKLQQIYSCQLGESTGKGSINKYGESKSGGKLLPVAKIIVYGKPTA